MLKSVLKRLGKFFATLGMSILVFVLENKVLSAAIALMLVLAITLSVVLSTPKTKNNTIETVSPDSSVSVILSSDVPSQEPVTSLESSSEEKTTTTTTTSKEVSTTSKKPTSSKDNSSKKPTPSKKPTSNAAGWENKYNTNLDIEDNVFMDSMVYTGYNLKKHRKDGNMWKYILASRKRGLGYLSNISYGGGSSGYETKNGKPDLKAFARGGLVCASYATYVYFNYLPNVAGIDTSSLPRPEDSTLAAEWYKAAMKWVKLGYSKEISFTAKKDSSNYIVFKPSEEIPIGSIVIFSTVRKDGSVHWERRSHVAIYGGYKNGYNWIYHVGNENGPEMCAIERVLYGPDPQWPYAVITPPSNIRMAANLTVSVTDEEGKAISGATVTAKNSDTGKTVTLGKTDKNGKASVEGLKYSKYSVTVSAGKEYEEKAVFEVSLNTKNNSQNILAATLKKKATNP